MQKKRYTIEELATAKRLYDENLAPVSNIAKGFGLTERDFYRRLNRWGWRRRKPRLITQGRTTQAERLAAGAERPGAEGAAAASASEQNEPHAPLDLAVIMQCIEARVRVEVASLAATLRKGAGGGAQADRNARILASLVKTLAGLQRFENVRRANPTGDRKDEFEQGAAPRTLDQLRIDLAEGLNRLRGSRNF